MHPSWICQLPWLVAPPLHPLLISSFIHIRMKHLHIMYMHALIYVYGIRLSNCKKQLMHVVHVVRVWMCWSILESLEAIQVQRQTGRVQPSSCQFACAKQLVKSARQKKRTWPVIRKVVILMRQRHRDLSVSRG